MKGFTSIRFVLESSDPGRVSLQRAVALAEHNRARLAVISVIAQVSGAIGIPSMEIIRQVMAGGHDLLVREIIDYVKPQQHLVRGWARQEVPLLAIKLRGFVTPVTLED